MVAGGRPVRPVGQRKPPTVEWLLGEALTCLYVGLCRYHRGEKLSAQLFIQHYAHKVKHIILRPVSVPGQPVGLAGQQFAEIGFFANGRERQHRYVDSLYKQTAVRCKRRLAEKPLLNIFPILPKML
jgi:hypothetical protein